MLAWHLLSEDKRLGYGDGRLVEVGQTLECKGKPVLCSNGMHGSAMLIDALSYANGPIVCRVEIEGDVIEGDDKLCGRRRTVLWMLDATRILHEFACTCAEDALALVERPDERSVAAIAAKRRWLNGEITDEELDSARAAAWDAARAAWDAALASRAAARDAARASRAARDASRAAARDAARASRAARDASRAARDAARAARAAARSASRSASRAASLAAAGAAVGDAARAKQNERLTAMVMQAHEKEGK